jgi:2,5-diketo-D-gluconate reductase A
MLLRRMLLRTLLIATFAVAHARTHRSPTVRLNDGRELPVLGIGTFRVPPGNATYTAVRSALRVGYRHIDTAQGYFNEEAVGRAVADSGVPRADVWVTTKLSSVWTKVVTYRQTLAALRASLTRLRMDYVDLYLIHSPRDATHRVEQWRALMHAKELGLARSIGVSDYEVAQLRELADAKVPPAVLQTELNPWLARTREAELRYCAQRGIVVEAWGALTTGKQLGAPEVLAVAAQHSTSAAAVLLRWGLQSGHVVLTTSQSAEHQAANLAVAAAGSWQLEPAELAALGTLSARPFFTINGQDISGDGRTPPRPPRRRG